MPKFLICRARRAVLARTSHPVKTDNLTAYMPTQLARRALLLPVLVLAMRVGMSLSLLALVSLGLPGAARAEETRPTVFVFLQLDVKSSALEQALQRQLPNLMVTVYGRFRDFQDDVVSKRPDAIVAITSLLDLDHTRPTLQGVRGGKDWEPYVLVSAGGNAKASMAGKTVGVVDLLGRDGTQLFATTVLGTTDIKVKRVAKLDDLLPLLEFSAADAVLIPASAVKRLTERTRMILTVRDLPGARVGLPALAVRNEPAKEAVVQAMHRIDLATRTLLGIDSWSGR